MQCKKCKRKFILTSNHKGFANICENCDGNDVEQLMAEVSWEGKHTPVIKVTTAAKAKAFNRKSKRLGAGVLSGIVTTRETTVGREASKSGSGAESGATYHSKLGEKHSVKR